ncbi:MAG: tetratricopeptide repeat protein [Bacteroidetes bacterium]|nr:tetratricopeptide repeat protein [Bacteroidota bacterium]
MKKILYIILLVFTTFSASAAENIDTLLVRAETYYTQKQYDSALNLYMQVYDQNLRSADLFYNIGNTHFKSDNLAQSILWYERALLLDPKHHEAQNNLAFVNARQIDKVEVLPSGIATQFFQSIYRFFSYTTWAVLSLIFLIVFLAALILFLFTQSVGIKKFAFGVGIFSLIVAILCFVCANAHNNMVKNNNDAIIMEATVTIKTEPAKTATDLVTVHEGLKVEFLKTHGEWANIRLLDGKEGWVKKDKVEKIK